jgi:ribosome-associated protein
VTATDTAIQLAQIAGHAAADKLATDIVLIDVSDRLAITDVFVIATGSNERQVEAIVDEVEEKLRLAGSKPLRREGKRDGRWVLLDYSEIVVHVQHAEERVFYALERLWRDCPLIDFDPMAAGPSPVRLPVDGRQSAAEPEDPTGSNPTKSDSTEPDSTESDSTESDSTESDSTESDSTEAEPTAASPAAASPAGPSSDEDEA